MTTIEERLNAQLDEKDEEIEELRSKIRGLENSLEGAESGWSLHREIEDEHPDLPLPRLEMVWTPSKSRGWASYVCEYRMVMKHLCGHLVVVPMGVTKIGSGAGKSPFETGHPIANELPFRDGSHAHHDAAHFGMPFYALTPTGPVRLDGKGGYDHARKTGAEHRRG